MMNQTPPNSEPAGDGDDPITTILGALDRADSVLIVSHEKPDGDAVGSILAMHLALSSLSRKTYPATADGCPEKYQFLPQADVITAEAPRQQMDCAIALDCDGERRLGTLRDAFGRSKCTINIDHHQSQRHFADINYCDRSKAATGVMLYGLLQRLKVDISTDIATCLYCAVATDTGIFQYDNTNAEALRVASELVERGADPTNIARRTYYRQSLPQAKLLGRALSSLQSEHGGDLLVATLHNHDFAEVDALAEHTDGIVDTMQRIDGARVIALFKQSDPDTWHVSMRSAQTDVARICGRHGGGGHTKAAGCELQGTAEQVRQIIIEDVADALG